MIVSFRALLKETWKNLWQHLWTYLLTAIILQIGLAYLAKGLLSFLFNRVVGFAGLINLTPDSWSAIRHHPLALLFFCLYLLVLAGTIYLEFAILTITVARTYQPLSIRQIIKDLPQKWRELCSCQLLVFLFYLTLMVPLAVYGLKFGLLSHFNIPNVISDPLVKSSLGKFSYLTGLILIVYFNLRFIYFIPLYTINNRKPSQVLRDSWQLTRGTQIKVLAFFGCYSLSTGLGLTLIYSGAALLFDQLDQAGNNLLLQTSFDNLVRFLNFGTILELKYVLIILLTSHLLKHKKYQLHLSYRSEDRPVWGFPHWTRLLIPLTLLTCLISNGLSLYLLPHHSQALLIAHRGDDTHGVENSITAMQAAHKAGADYSEMDVVMTKDQQFVVSHDNNLKRLTGLDKNISDLTLAQVIKLKTYQNGHSDHIASLDEFMKAAQACHQKIAIELKPYGHEPANYVDIFLKKLKDLKAVQGNKIMSMKLPVIEAIERKLPQADTGYLVSLQFGPLPPHKVDFYAIEEFSYNNVAALSAYQQKKDLYVWTVNDDSLLFRFLHSPVNGIITDKLTDFKTNQKEIDPQDSYFDRVIRLLKIEFTDS
ncbi:glycerophosphoryl diester phosphodiesterase membrane domain-containing protein [Streptococcus tangpeifui]|uniref:glycerophosphoryl diester phosphodiesterase membrane domain-containing protein n=1 Tax=Streptococcus tangpeifui TaxID=2709400 RepID=UPI0013EA6776|nr:MULTISPECIES: glycerophosphodiester phosphodiesterase [unclassified Streptococcus]